jgi:hypothetical protein
MCTRMSTCTYLPVASAPVTKVRRTARECEKSSTIPLHERTVKRAKKYILTGTANCMAAKLFFLLPSSVCRYLKVLWDCVKAFLRLVRLHSTSFTFVCIDFVFLLPAFVIPLTFSLILDHPCIYFFVFYASLLITTTLCCIMPSDSTKECIIPYTTYVFSLHKKSYHFPPTPFLNSRLLPPPSSSPNPHAGSLTSNL